MNIIVVTRRTENGQLYSVLKLTHIRFLVFQHGNGWTVWSKTTIIYKGCAFNRGLTARMCVNVSGVEGDFVALEYATRGISLRNMIERIFFALIALDEVTGSLPRSKT